MILAIDQGTTGSTCFVFDTDGTIAGRGYAEFTQHFPKPGWVEHDAEEIWEVTKSVASRALAEAGIDGTGLDAIGITNQRETVVGWDPATGRPVHNALVWQDRRTADRCAALKAAGHEPMVRERTGLVLDPYFSASKIQWLLENVEGAGTASFGTIDSWLVFKLTGEHATDYSNASRTMLFNIHDLKWDEDLCTLFGVDPAALPTAMLSAGVFGVTTEFGGEVPVAGIAGDQQAALFGQACFEPGNAKNTYGTGSFVLQNTGPAAVDPGPGLVSTLAWGIGDEVTYALEASVFVTGAAVQWLRDGLGLIENAAETEALAASLESNDDVYFVPALTGLGSPYWDPYARGTIVGLTRGTTRAHLARATLEAIAFQTVDAVRAQEQVSGKPLENLKADGGAVSNRWLMQFQADVLGAPVAVSEIPETTALGAAFMAGVGIGTWSLDDIASMWSASHVYEPQMEAGHREKLLEQWSRAVEKSRGWASESDQ